MPEHKKGVVPRLRFPEFRNAGEWDVERGDTLFGQISNRDHDGTLPVLAVTQEHGAIPREFIDYQVFVTEESLKSYKMVDIGDFIISLRTFQGGIEYSYYRGICSPAYIILRKANDKVFDDFYRHYFKTERYIRALNRNLEGLRDGKMVSYRQFSDIPLPFPSLPEQQKIADCLSSLDEVIELEAQKLDAFKTHKKGLMQQLFPREGETTPRLRFPEFRDAGPWEVKRLSNTLHRISNGLTIAQVSGSCGVKVTRIETISTGRIDPNKVGYVNTDQDITQYRLRIGDILFSHINSLTHIGKSAYVDKDYNLYHGMNLLRLSVDAESNDSRFVFYLINTSIFQFSVRARANQAINQASINQTELGQSCVLIPTKKEQQKIADCLSSLDEVIELEAQKLDVLKTHKKGLMQQLFPQEVD